MSFSHGSLEGALRSFPAVSLSLPSIKRLVIRSSVKIRDILSSQVSGISFSAVLSRQGFLECRNDGLPPHTPLSTSGGEKLSVAVQSQEKRCYSDSNVGETESIWTLRDRWSLVQSWKTRATLDQSQERW